MASTVLIASIALLIFTALFIWTRDRMVAYIFFMIEGVGILYFGATDDIQSYLYFGGTLIVLSIVAFLIDLRAPFAKKKRRYG